jgi:hypothetical protein
MNWEQVGTYCGRAVWIARLEESDAASGIGSLCDSTLLVVLKAGAVSGAGGEALFRSLAVAQPLSICLFGAAADAAFDTLLGVLSRFSSDGHIMTKLCHGETFQESLDDFLGSSWPSEDRHDNWTHCRIVVVDSGVDYLFYVNQVRMMLTV